MLWRRYDNALIATTCYLTYLVCKVRQVIYIKLLITGTKLPRLPDHEIKRYRKCVVHADVTKNNLATVGTYVECTSVASKSTELD